MISIKKPYPFKTILSAVAYSPRLEANLNEAARFCNLLGAKWVLVHAGERNMEKEQKLKDILNNIPFPVSPQIEWKEGSPVEVVLEVCQKHKVDLIIAGALQRENILKYYIGSISREICRNSLCSVLLLTEPKAENNPLHRILVDSPASDEANLVIETSAYIAKHYADCEFTIAKEHRAHRLVNSLSSDNDDSVLHYKEQSLKMEEEMLIEDIKACSNLDGIPYKTIVLEGKPGHAINYYARKIKADMLCVNGFEKKGTILDRIFINDIEYILEDIPCTLLIVKTIHQD